MKKSKNRLQEVRAQAKAIITLFIVGSIDVIANILQTVLFLAIDALADPNNRVYLLPFTYILIDSCFHLSQALVYGLFIKKIRNRLPSWMVCYRQLIIRRNNRVGIVYRQAQAGVSHR